ncbi:hypothetical protein ENBRE01_2423 [Enteropsectra breve]|nr:hypothetical protein ENBRE01_2423 [Enteropsectra breve]
MEILNETYRAVDNLILSFEMVPRVVLVSNTSEMSIDYHKGLLPLATGDDVQVRLYLEEPILPSNIYLMRGTVYKIEEDGFECSFGGLLLFYKGKIHENLLIDSEIFVSIAKI